MSKEEGFLFPAVASRSLREKPDNLLVDLPGRHIATEALLRLRRRKFSSNPPYGGSGLGLLGVRNVGFVLMAERGGFEPPVRVYPVRQFSKLLV